MQTEKLNLPKEAIELYMESDLDSLRQDENHEVCEISL